MSDWEPKRFDNKPNVPHELFRRLYDAFALSAFMPAHYENGAPKARNGNDRGKTRRGAVHQVNPAFRSVNLLGVSPAQYRRFHLGLRQKVTE
jgi:hypothetical protein